MRRSVRLATVQFIVSTKTMAIVFLPGAMTGMILDGAHPLQAVRFQVVIVFVLLAEVSLTATIVSRPPPAACSRRRCKCGWSPHKEEGRGPWAPRPGHRLLALRFSADESAATCWARSAH